MSSFVLAAAAAFAESRDLEIRGRRALEMRQRSGAVPSRSFPAAMPSGRPADPRNGPADARGIVDPLG